MKILIQQPPHARHASVVRGWENAFKAAGHAVRTWLDNGESAFDAFDDARPDLFVMTREPARAVLRCFAERKHMKIVDRREFRPAFDATVFRPGRFDPNLACDACFVGDYRAGKRRLLDEHILPLLGRFKVKLFGATTWGVPQYVGPIPDAVLPDLYASARVCLDVSESRPGERFYQVAGLGGHLVSNVAVGGSPSGHGLFLETVEAAISRPEDGLVLQGECHRHYVLHSETYAHRVARMFREAGMDDEAGRVLDP